VIGFEEWKTFQPRDTELAMIRFPEEAFPYVSKEWTELCNLHVGTVCKTICTDFE